MSLSNFSIGRPVTTAMFFLGVSLLGLISLARLPVELMPEVVYPEIFVTVLQQGMAPEQVERDLVMPVEEEVSQLEGIVELTSTAALNRGNVRISYEPGTDMKFALLQVQSRMDRLQPSFPPRTQINVQRFDEGGVAIAVDLAGGICIGHPVAVVVGTITGLRVAWEVGRVVVVTVGTGR